MLRVFQGISRYFMFVLLLMFILGPGRIYLYAQVETAEAGAWSADLGNGSFRNPIIYADYSDPDVIRVGEDFYMVSSSFNCVPGIPLLHSKDMVNWKIINHIFQRQIPDTVFNYPQHGNGAWAPSIRYHNGAFYVYYGDPDFGIYMSIAYDPLGDWSAPHLLCSARGWIDPCPLWDEDGNAYLVHAFAGSRSGRKSILVVHRMSPDGKTLLDDGVLVFDGHENHPTIEGPKFYKRNGYYYIFAPGGGVQYGWQTVLRSRNIYGPYEDRVVLEQGETEINGPHQGAWVELANGESWFYHFQDKDAYGRIVHMQPMKWEDDWPVMGSDQDGDGIGEPVSKHPYPNTGYKGPLFQIQSSDEFNSAIPGLQWQWHANPEAEWMFLSGSEGFMRLYCQHNSQEDPNLWEIPHLYLQKFPSNEFTATAKIRFFPRQDGDRVGLVIMGMSYAALIIEQVEGQMYYTVIHNHEAEKGGENLKDPLVSIQSEEVFLRVNVMDNATCSFSFSLDGENFTQTGEIFEAEQGKWIGAKVGLYAIGSRRTNDTGWADIDWFRITKL